MFNINEDHMYTENKTVINLDNLVLTVSTNTIKTVLTDLEDFQSLFNQEKQLQQPQYSNQEIKKSQKLFKEFIFEYKAIDITFQNKDDLIGVNFSTSRGLFSKNNQGTSLNTENANISLKNSNDLSESEQRTFPVMKFNRIFAKVSTNEKSMKNSNYFNKQAFKVKEISITL